MKYIYVAKHNWQSWWHFSLQSFWSGHLLYMNISKFAVVLDFSEDFIDDVINGKVK